MTVLILGAACGYSDEQIQPFLESVNRAIPDSKVVLFMKPGQRLGMKGIQCVYPQDFWLRSVLRRLPRGTRLGSELAFGMGRLLEALGVLENTFVKAAFGVAVARYFWYRDCLRSQAADGCNWVLLSDTRDVVFQADPFEGMDENRLFCGMEPVALGQCPVNSSWYRRAYGDQHLGEIAARPVLCSGVTGGPRHLVELYLDRMCLEIRRIGRRVLWSSGFDQAIHNHLLRQTALKDLFKFEDWNSDRLTTLHYVDLSAFRIDQLQELRNASGKTVSIVHQYDRHPHLVEWVKQRWGNGL